MLPFTEEVIQIIREIPQGKVMTYGQIAKKAGNARAARQVARILHTISKKYQLPWHRVINAQGKIALQDEEKYYEQLVALESEGITVSNTGSVDLEKYRAE